MTVEAEFDVAKMFVAKFSVDDQPKMTANLLSKYCEALKATPTVHFELKLVVTLEASTATSAKSFSVLKNIMPDCRQSMNYAGKSCLATCL